MGGSTTSISVSPRKKDVWPVADEVLTINGRGSSYPSSLGPESQQGAGHVAAGSSARGRGWVLSVRRPLWECGATRSRQAGPEQAQESSFGHAGWQVVAFLKLCKTPPCQTFTPPGTLLSRRRPRPGAPAGSADSAGPSSSAEDPSLSAVKPRSPQYEMAPRTVSSLRAIFAFSSLSNSILAAMADSAPPTSAPRAAVAERSRTTACPFMAH